EIVVLVVVRLQGDYGQNAAPAVRRVGTQEFAKGAARAVRLENPDALLAAFEVHKRQVPLHGPWIFRLAGLIGLPLIFVVVAQLDTVRALEMVTDKADEMLCRLAVLPSHPTLCCIIDAADEFLARYVLLVLGPITL